ncbi:AAA family ATPase [Paraburkholderia sp. USG1]|uniref:ATP-binding protein n=1 Tax=Paraburkholderia sp. USG1 TaxID=2952268 RepID=UPI002860C273|nr:AAA family ATPase [Paraburkholderia sp. USG1]MDR8402324.1 AAA family ATPase [Paraburkholderia sp. USG1]
MYIKEVVLHRFKQFNDTQIPIEPGLSLVVGGNNSGKSSVLQALATWQFCKTLLEIEKGRKAWVSVANIQGIGMGIVDFTPMHIPSLAHLWTNLKSQKSQEPDGYTLKIKVLWERDDKIDKFLEIGLSLANDRLFVKTTATNLTLAEVEDANGNPIDGGIPNIAYLPPFAGVTDRESRLTPAMRSRLLGQGLSGGVIRNAIFDLHESNRVSRSKLREGRTKIKNSDLATLRANDPWEILQKTMQEVFATELRIVPFNERYHSYLKVECVKGRLQNGVFTKHTNFSSRDLMVEGSGFLQWLSVYALALSPDIDVVLLDEPDAHLHALLQQQLVGQLKKIAESKGKQVLLATHSPELIRSYDHERILALKDRRARYLARDVDKVGILAGVGAIHTPTLHALMQHQRMLIVEAESDERFLRLLASSAGFAWPKNLVSWYWTGKPNERRQLFIQLKRDIADLRAISIRDRDDEPDGTVGGDLVDKSFTNNTDGFTALKWRRRHIENYLLCTAAIARAAGKSKDEVQSFFATQHALAIPDDTTASEIVMPIRDARGKELMTEGNNSVRRSLGVKREEVAKALSADEIAADIRTFFNAIADLCANE